MLWNVANKAMYEFVNRYHYASSEIHMSQDYYNALLNEMYGNQQYVLDKFYRFRGCKVVIDNSQVMFAVKGRHSDEVSVKVV